DYQPASQRLHPRSQGPAADVQRDADVVEAAEQPAGAAFALADGQPGDVADDGAVEQSHAVVEESQRPHLVLARRQRSQIDRTGLDPQPGRLKAVGRQHAEKLVEAALEVGLGGGGAGGSGEVGATLTGQEGGEPAAAEQVEGLGPELLAGE